MILYRITSKAYARDLSGTGAYLHGGRWNAKGTRMLYTSESLSLAMLEVIANLSGNHLNDSSLYGVELEFPDQLLINELKILPENWNAFPHAAASVNAGNDFIQQGALCLKVPSAIIPSESNYLLNPMNDLFNEVKFIDARPLILDERLLNK